MFPCSLSFLLSSFLPFLWWCWWGEWLLQWQGCFFVIKKCFPFLSSLRNLFVCTFVCVALLPPNISQCFFAVIAHILQQCYTLPYHIGQYMRLQLSGNGFKAAKRFSIFNLTPLTNSSPTTTEIREKRRSSSSQRDGDQMMNEVRAHIWSL